MRSRPLAGRELWRIGDWGAASGHIGRRWEAVAASMLDDLVGKEAPNQPGFVPRAYVSFVHETTLEKAVQAAGLSHSDALLLGPHHDRLAIQPVDFKWSLEVARPEQVAGDTLHSLLQAEVPAIQRALREGLAGVEWGSQPPCPPIAGGSGEPPVIGGQGGFDASGQPASTGSVPELPHLDALELLDGRFLAPDHAANRAFLDSPANRSSARPLLHAEVVLEPVDGPEFFRPLPGWELGQAIAFQEGARRALDSVEGAERYYRLGAGVLGALTARQQSIFEPTSPAIDGGAELTALRRAQRLTTTEQVVAHLDRVMRARSDLRKTFNQLGRQLFPFSAYRQVLKAAGITVPERDDPSPEGPRLASLYGLTQRELAAHLAAEGRKLVATGQTDAQALATLAARAPDLAREAATIARRLADEELRRAEPSPSST